MDWQMLSVAVLVGVASFYLARRSWRAWTGRKAAGCGGGCSCPEGGAGGKVFLIGEKELTSRLRARP